MNDMTKKAASTISAVVLSMALTAPGVANAASIWSNFYNDFNNVDGGQNSLAIHVVSSSSTSISAGTITGVYLDFAINKPEINALFNPYGDFDYTTLLTMSTTDAALLSSDPYDAYVTSLTPGNFNVSMTSSTTAGIYGSSMNIYGVLLGSNSINWFNNLETAFADPVLFGLSGAFNFVNPNDLNIGTDFTLTAASAVPVPAAVWLFGSGLVGLVGVARRKKTQNA